MLLAVNWDRERQFESSLFSPATRSVIALSASFPLCVINLDQCGECLSKIIQFGATFFGLNFCIFCQINDEVNCMLPVRLSPTSQQSGFREWGCSIRASALSLEIPTLSRSMPESRKFPLRADHIYIYYIILYNIILYNIILYNTFHVWCVRPFLARSTFRACISHFEQVNAGIA